VTTHKTGTREQWLKARLELLKAEKELTHPRDELAHQRQELPWVPINKGYGSALSTPRSNSGRAISKYNYRREAPLRRHGWEGAPISRSTSDGPATFAAMCGTDAATYIRERPGMSAFALEDGVVYHAYSTYARGLDSLWGMYQ
jgi:predicted dithiol-disulfide oxidoreductase (DUF899 family)